MGLRQTVGVLLRMLWDDKISLLEFERRMEEEEDRQQSLQLGIGAATEKRVA